MDSEFNTFGTINIPVNVSSEYDVDDNSEKATEAPSTAFDEDIDTITNINEIIKNSDYEYEIEGAPYTRNNPFNKKERPVKEITYGTTQVAQMLGVTPQTIRNYIKDYNEFLGIDIVQAGSTERAQFTREDVEILREVMKVKDENNFTTDQMLAYMSDPNHVGYVPESKKYDKAVEMLITTVSKMLEESNQKYLGIINQQDQQYTKSVGELSEMVQKQSTQINEMKDAFENQQRAIDNMLANSKDETQKRLEEIESRNSEAISQLEKEKAGKIRALNDEKLALKNQLEQKIGELNKEIQEQKNQNSDLKEKNKDHTQKEENLETKISDLAMQNEILQKEIDELRALQNKRKKFLGIF